MTTQICSQHYISILHMHNIKKMEFFYCISIGTPEYIIEVFSNLKNEHLWTIEGLASSDL